MAKETPVVASFREGMKRDFARTAMPDGSLWNLINLLPEVLEAPARKRGGYTHASQAISAVTASASYIADGIFAPFSDGDSIIVFDEDGRAYEIESTTGTENIGAGVTTRSSAFYSDKLIVAHDAGTTAPKKITRSSSTHTLAALSGSPPAGRYLAVYKDVLWLASPAASADRIFFSTAGNPEDTWDTTNKYLDASFPISGMEALQNAVFVFGLDRTMRVRGSIPPPDSDFIVDDPIFDVGCTDNRSIAKYRDKVIWGNAQGLYISDGTALEDLTRVCGMKRWWQAMMAGEQGFSTGTAYSVTGWSIATAVLGDWLLYAVMNGSTEVDSGMIDLTRYTWFRHSNFDFVNMFVRPYPQEVFLCRRGASYLAKASPLFLPTSANKADADGTVVLPSYETGYGLGGGLLKTARRAYLIHDTRDAASDAPTQTISYIDSPEETSYTALSPTAPATTEITRVHRPMNKPMRGVAFKVEQTNASSDTRHYGLGLEYSEREVMK